jgi:hypothetical protein
MSACFVPYGKTTEGGLSLLMFSFFQTFKKYLLLYFTWRSSSVGEHMFVIPDNNVKLKPMSRNHDGGVRFPGPPFF